MSARVVMLPLTRRVTSEITAASRPKIVNTVFREGGSDDVSERALRRARGRARRCRTNAPTLELEATPRPGADQIGRVVLDPMRPSRAVPQEGPGFESSPGGDSVGAQRRGQRPAPAPRVPRPTYCSDREMIRQLSRAQARACWPLASTSPRTSEPATPSMCPEKAATWRMQTHGSRRRLHEDLGSEGICRGTSGSALGPPPPACRRPAHPAGRRTRRRQQQRAHCGRCRNHARRRRARPPARRPGPGRSAPRRRRGR